jgi:hypothetical protein
LCSCVEYVFTFLARKAMTVRAVDIDIRVERLEQLFDTLDPAPLRERALNVGFEAYLRDCAAEHPPGSVLRLRLQGPAELYASQDQIQAGIRSHFGAALVRFRRQARSAQQRYRRVVAVGFLVLAVSLLLRRLIEGWHGPVSELLVEGLLVLGWVALWRPIEVLLFDRSDARRLQRQLESLASIELRWLPPAA